jgi:hypothetical protein
MKCVVNEMGGQQMLEMAARAAAPRAAGTLWWRHLSRRRGGKSPLSDRQIVD